MYKLMGNSMTGKGVGWDVAGVVVAVGAKVTSLAVGDAVFGQCDMGKKDGGGLSEYTVTEADWVAKKPESLSFVEASCLGVAGVTSLRALAAGKMKAGDNVLIVGGSGGCGSMAIQFAKQEGAGKVTAICSDKNVELCRELGADVVVSYSAGEAKLKEGLQAQAPFDLAYDTVTSPDDPPYEHILRPVLKKNGMLVTINGTVGDFVRSMMSGCLNLQRKNFCLVINVPNKQTGPELAKIGAWVAEKKVKVLMDRTVAFTAEGIAEGYDAMVGRRVKGKVVAVTAAGEARKA